MPERRPVHPCIQAPREQGGYSAPQLPNYLNYSKVFRRRERRESKANFGAMARAVQSSTRPDAPNPKSEAE
jgi:hypothetical protein